jgi:hypothetical protein
MHALNNHAPGGPPQPARAARPSATSGEVRLARGLSAPRAMSASLEGPRTHDAPVPVLVEIGPEGWTPTQQPPFLSHPPLATAKDTTATSAKKEDAETKQHKEKHKGTLSRPKTEGTAIAFGALF